jgi:hydroxypyruvate reductase
MMQLTNQKYSGTSAAGQTLQHIFSVAIAAADPYNAVLNAGSVVQSTLHIAGVSYDLATFERILAVGAGKATARMALAVETLLHDKITAGLIIVKEGHTASLSVIEQIESTHPVPGEAGVEGSRRILDMLRAADERTLIICLLSGGASALMVAPAEGPTLQDKQDTTRLLLNAGATINELNAVRKHLSAVKGGKLAQAAFRATILTLIVSDVIGDPLDVIASGPTTADSSTFAEAWGVIARYELQYKIPPRVASYLQRGVAGVVEETVKANDPCLQRVRNVIIVSIKQALLAAEKESVHQGFSVKTITDKLSGEARAAARWLAQVALDELALMKPGEQYCLLSGGETTVTVHGTGKGGRNQELALAFALEIEGVQGVTLLSAGTDGTDGPNDAAGAIVDGSTVSQARAKGIDPVAYLDDNDSYHFFQQLDAAADVHSHLIIGPTGTNVMDMQIVILSKG